MLSLQQFLNLFFVYFLQMTDNTSKIIKSIRPSKIIFPILIGLGVTGFLLYREYQPGSFSLLSFTVQSIFWLLLSFGMMVLRDLGYIIRIRILSNNELSWRKSFKIIMLWEFASTVTPSAIGGTSVAVFFVNKEGINFGRSAAIVLVTSFFDELYFIIMFPLLLILIGASNIFALEGLDAVTTWHINKFVIIAFIGYSIKLSYLLLVSYAIFINPLRIKQLLLFIFKIPFIRRWRGKAEKTGDDLIEASKEFKRWSLIKWLKAFGATFMSWTARYWVVNTLIITFFGINLLSWSEQILIFGKQLVMWIMMLVSPTPGGSGFAEYFFKEFLGAFIPAGTGVAMALLWRMVSYYPYLFIGAIVVPRWIKKLIVSQ